MACFSRRAACIPARNDVVAKPPCNARLRTMKVSASALPSAAVATVPSNQALDQVVSPRPRSVPELDPMSFYDFIGNSDELCVVDYYTDWCGPCKLMHKEVDNLTAAFKNVKFAKLNCGTCEEFSSRQRIRSLPTFRLYYKGACVDEITGAKPKQLRQLLTHHLFMLSTSAAASA